MDEYEQCWETTNYTGQDCYFCDHKYECSASGFCEEEDDE